MPILYRVVLSFSFLFFFTHAHAAESLEKIVLQLPWYHQFQFAGYYAAVEQGYYKEAGLDVSLNPGRPGLRVIDEVVSGRAQYGVARSELLLHRLKGEPVVALAAVFQQSAIVMLARQDSGIKSPQDMIGRRVMLLEGGNAAEYIATFQSAKVTIDQISVIPSSFDIQDLIQGKTDVFNAYITNEPFLLEEQGIPYTIIKPSDYGIEFYGDTLFTSEEELGSNPDRVKAFRAASMRGWEYALSHHGEIIELLITEYETNKTRSQLRYEANAVEQLIMADLVGIGHMLSDRWQNMADVFVRLDMAEPGYSLAGFIYDPPLAPDYAKIRRWAVFVAVLLVLAFVIIILYFNRRLHRELEYRTRESKRNEALFRETFNNMQTGVAIYEAVDDGNDFLFKDLNPSGCRQGHVERGNILNKSVKEVFPEVVDLGLVDVFQRVWQTGEPALQPASVYRDEKIELWVENYIYKLPSGEIVAVYDDITGRKESERKQEQLERFESLRTMAGAIAHRFNNAIMTVQGNLDLMLTTLPDHLEEKQMVSDALQAVNGASLVGTMMLTYLGQRPLDLHVSCLSDLAGESVTELKNQMGPSVSLKFISPPAPLYCSMDKPQIKEVLMNILINAIESLDNEAGEIEISFGIEHVAEASFPVVFQDNLAKNGMYIFCQIMDTGQGITAENLQRLFEPFFTTKFVGRGLGLALSGGIMRSHHGAILVESKPGAGTTVRMLLPAMEHPQKEILSPAGSKKDVAKLSGDILFADDDDTICNLGKRMLERLGFTVHTAVNGLEAVEMVRRQDINFRAVVLDISMPEMDGMEAMQQIKKSNPDLPILLSSGSSEEDLPVGEDLATKPDGFLQKPFLFSDLQQSLEKLLF